MCGLFFFHAFHTSNWGIQIYSLCGIWPNKRSPILMNGVGLHVCWSTTLTHWVFMSPILPHPPPSDAHWVVSKSQLPLALKDQGHHPSEICLNVAFGSFPFSFFLRAGDYAESTQCNAASLKSDMEWNKRSNYTYLTFYFIPYQILERQHNVTPLLFLSFNFGPAWLSSTRTPVPANTHI